MKFKNKKANLIIGWSGKQFSILITRKRIGAGVVVMKKSIKKSLITSGLLTLLLISSNIPGFCSNNATLSAINIEGTKNSFNITLKMSKDVDIQSKVLSNDRMVLELDKTTAATLLQTKFNKASNIEDVIVQPISNNKTRLFISGKNISKSKIIIDSTKTAIVSDKFAQDESYSIIKRTPQRKIVAPQETLQAQENSEILENVEAQENIDTQVANNESISAEEFIANNQTEEESTDFETASDIETTGIISAPPETIEPSEEVETILDETNEIPTTSSSDLFKPEADLNYETNNSNRAPVETTAAATVKNIQTNNNSFPFSNTNLIRFSIAFILVLILVAYLRKENLLSFGDKKSQKQAQRKEPLDISRSLSRPARVTTTKRSTSSGLDRVTASGTRNRITANSANNTIKKHTALTGYTKQQQQKPINLTNRQQQSQTLSKNPLLDKQAFNKQLGINNKTTQGITNRAAQIAKKPATQKQTYNVDFLKSMADHYEKTGRHDLAKNIQRSLQRSSNKS